MVGKYLVALGGSPAKRNLALSALRGFFDRLVQRHVVILNPAASVKGVKETVIEGKTPEITVEQARTLMKSIKLTYQVKPKGKKPQEVASVMGLRDRAIMATLIYTACRTGAVARCGCRTSSTTGHSSRSASIREGRQEPGNPGAARPGGVYPRLS